MKPDKEWFKSHIRERGLTYQKVGSLMDLDSGTISKIFSGDRRLQLGELPRLARVLGLPAETVAEKLGVALPAGAETVPLTNRVDRFGRLQPLSGPARRVAAAPNCDERTVAARVLDPQSALYGWTYYWTPAGSVTSRADGRLCVVNLQDGGTVLRVVRAGRQPGQWDLYTQDGDPAESGIVVSAAPVRWIDTQAP